MTALDQIRGRSGMRNVDLEINRIPAPFEVFVHHVNVAAHKLIEVHFPIDCVSIGTNGETVFNAQAQEALDYARQLAERSA